jgi:hypothetical protein
MRDVGVASGAAIGGLLQRAAAPNEIDRYQAVRLYVLAISVNRRNAFFR